jgi:hypothetical protein
MFFTVEGGDLSTTTGPAPSDSTGFSSVTGASIGSSIGIASANNRNTRLKIAISTIGIWGFTESRAVQAAALTRALDCLKGTGLGPNKGVFFILFIDIFFPMQIGNWGQIRCFFLLVLSLSSLYFHSQDCCLIAFLGHRSYSSKLNKYFSLKLAIAYIIFVFYKNLDLDGFERSELSSCQAWHRNYFLILRFLHLTMFFIIRV